ncbi:DUF4956 domain-containing protein [Ruminococcus sp.]|uniref:DUF4956 domain-containing protein n=1 Tax=Ruminococcus sp. TaxID=41978 RepID=UPI0025E15C8E|nr:DUF4956 domain-containing protein [Ruminococcus sp.]MCI2112325.1 DUF4956 domain-containing protein [Ruminococcus sp.]MDD6989799.1 DUF4956 domain-containing protein [Ruminococcus sp.]MDY6202801.1 DUF4956 domain-containing protein [Ruminococcus sp.]
MLETLFNPIYTTNFTFSSYIICTVVSLVLGLIIALSSGFKSRQSRSFLLSLFLLPAIVQTVIMLVNGSVGTGIAVMGAFSLVRFRSVPGSAKEIVSIFLAMATGLATAMGYVFLASLFVIIVCAVMMLSSFVKIKEKDDLVRELRITVPEDLNYAHSFDDLFETYTKSVKLVTVKTTNMGSLYKLVYKIQLNDEEHIQSFIDDLRCRNGNLEISIAIPAVAENVL